MYPTSAIALSLLVAAATVQSSPGTDADTLQQKWGTDWPFSGISTFAHLPHIRCLTNPEEKFDIGIIGAPFDTSVSYRPGARFGPRAIRASSSRQTSFRSFNHRAGINPYTSWARIIDCGDIPVSPFDNSLGLRQMTEAFEELGSRTPSADTSMATRSKVKLITLGGDHSVAMPALRALKNIYGQPVAVLHFDAHLDTWHPAKYPSAWIDHDDLSTQSFFNHGSMFWLASVEGLIAKGYSVHAGLRSRLSGHDDSDLRDDTDQGWYRIMADDIDDIGVQGIIDSIISKLGRDTPVYLSIDIDVIDPGMAPGTGTPEPGGWTSREVIRILRGIEDLNIVGADIVEVSPSYDDTADSTSLVAAQLVFEVLSSMVKKGMPDERTTGERKGAKDEL